MAKLNDSQVAVKGPLAVETVLAQEGNEGSEGNQGNEGDGQGVTNHAPVYLQYEINRTAAP